jgi:hypothetical protein
MLKLVSEVGTRWSFMNGYQVYGNVVWLMDVEDAKNYTLIDKDGNKMNVDSNDYIVDD